MYKFLFVITTFCLIQTKFFAQKEFPGYHPPLNIPLVLSANFGELRPNHFHMGLDFKTNGKIGYNLYAIEDGHVSRIKISTYGYGKVVYIDHPNGKTSVYAHCNELKGKLDSVVKSAQYAQERFDVEVFPKHGEVTVKKGDIIAVSGNTGSSSGPHLHFEIRDTKTEEALNPLVYGFDITDTISPEIRKVKVFGLNKDGYMIPGLQKEFTVSKKSNGQLFVAKDTLFVPSNFCSPSGGVGFAIDGADRLNAASNQCGLYGTFLVVDGDTIFGQRIDRVGFDESRFVNTHRDMSAMGSKYHKIYRNIANLLKIYTIDNLGIIKLNPSQSKNISIIAFDPKGNKTQLNFVLKITTGNINKDYEPSKSTHLYPEDSLIQKGTNWVVETPTGSIYEPTKIVQSTNAHFCDATVHMHKVTKIRMKLENPNLPTEKHYIAAGNNALKTRYEDGWLVAESKHAGTYSIKKDTIAPSIKGISFTSTNIVKGNIVKFSITESQSGLESFKLYIDDKWHLMEYENKLDLLFFEKPSNLLGDHAIKIIARDSCGNEVIYERTLNFQ